MGTHLSQGPASCWLHAVRRSLDETGDGGREEAQAGRAAQRALKTFLCSVGERLFRPAFYRACVTAPSPGGSLLIRWSLQRDVHVVAESRDGISRLGCCHVGFFSVFPKEPQKAVPVSTPVVWTRVHRVNGGYRDRRGVRGRS